MASFLAPPVGLEPTTLRLTAACSTGWAKEEYLSWRLPIVPGRCQPSIVGTSELNFCVRDGNRWTLTVINTNYSILSSAQFLVSLDDFDIISYLFWNCKPFLRFSELFLKIFPVPSCFTFIFPYICVYIRSYSPLLHRWAQYKTISQPCPPLPPTQENCRSICKNIHICKKPPSGSALSNAPKGGFPIHNGLPV